jgi:hypothetical protein
MAVTCFPVVCAMQPSGKITQVSLFNEAFRHQCASKVRSARGECSASKLWYTAETDCKFPQYIKYFNYFFRLNFIRVQAGIKERLHNPIGIIQRV